MGLLSCCGSSFVTLSRAAAKAAAARLRRLGIGGIHPQWQQRTGICARCHLCFIDRGISYCGRPLLRRIERDPAIDGCGCPILDKARAPEEHCPLDENHHPAAQTRGGCTCKWCNCI